MKLTIDETNRRRKKQKKYNLKNNITPSPIIKKIKNDIADSLNPYSVKKHDVIDKKMDNDQLIKMIKITKLEMEKSAKNLDFIQAANLRDKLKELQTQLKDSK